VGLDNQGESCLGWDALTGEPIGPVIVWQDDRTADEVDRLRAGGAEALTLARAGLPLDPYFSASKLAWILRETPGAAELARRSRLRLGTTDAFFRERLTGRFETDVTTASRTSLMNIATCEWDQELCALFGIPLDCLPRITPSTGDLGRLSLGEREVPLSASLVDQQAATYGHGCRRPGDAKITFGTGAFAFCLVGSDRPAEPQGCLPTVAWAKAGERPVYALDGGVYCAGSALNWAQDLGIFTDLAELGDMSPDSAISRGVAFVPALAGLACPHWDRHARGAWMGLDLGTGKPEMMRAVLEGIAFRMAEVIDAMDRVVPIRSAISIDGGLSANPAFCRILSGALDRPVLVSSQTELTAVGTATLAAEAVGRSVVPHQSGILVHSTAELSSWRPRFRAALEAVRSFGQSA
jgi:glycerol kinase